LKYKNSLDINVEPFETCVRRIQITCCENAPKNKLAQEYLDLLCDLKLVLNLPCILPMLEMVHTLIKYVQRQDVFICEFIDAMKSNEAELHQLYVDHFCKNDNFTFNEFTIVFEHCGELLPLS